jgi:hypothetical protein
MNTIKIKIEYDGEVTLNNEFTAHVTQKNPLELYWFPDSDLSVQTRDEKSVFNSKDSEPPYIIRPKSTDKNLKIIDGVDLKLAESGTAKFLVVNNKFACRLPEFNL